MGSWTSGNHSREKRLTIDELPSIEVREIAYLPLLPELWVSPPFQEVRGLKVQGDESVVVFGLKSGGKITEIGAAGLTYSTRNFGGQQAYFQCQCGRRITSLYMSGHSIACRHCHGLLYESQFSSKHEQPATKAAKLRARLGGPPALLKPLPKRPKGMHWETYNRLCYQINTYELEAAANIKQYQQDRWLPTLLRMDELAAQYEF